MAKKTQTKKEPSNGKESSKDLTLSVNDFNMENSTTQEEDAKKGRHFWFVVYPSKEWMEENVEEILYDGNEGWGTAPDNWIEELQLTGLPFMVSPLHDKDVNPDGTFKKPHFHVIVSWSNTTTYRSARGLCDLLKCPNPQTLKSVGGAFRYHKHLDNPEKYQYKNDKWSNSHNGWTPPLNNENITQIKQEIYYLILKENIKEYSVLVREAINLGVEYFEVVSNNTLYCDKLCTSYRNNPIGSILTHLKYIKDEEERELFETRLKELQDK